MKKIYVYAEQCARAGDIVSEEALEKWGEDSADFVAYFGTKEELLKKAEQLEKYGSVYSVKCAYSIREVA